MRMSFGRPYVFDGGSVRFFIALGVRTKAIRRNEAVRLRKGLQLRLMEYL